MLRRTCCSPPNKLHPPQDRAGHHTGVGRTYRLSPSPLLFPLLCTLTPDSSLSNPPPTSFHLPFCPKQALATMPAQLPFPPPAQQTRPVRFVSSPIMGCHSVICTPWKTGATESTPRPARARPGMLRQTYNGDEFPVRFIQTWDPQNPNGLSGAVTRKTTVSNYDHLFQSRQDHNGMEKNKRKDGRNSLAAARFALLPVACGTIFFCPSGTPNRTGGGGPVFCGTSGCMGGASAPPPNPVGWGGSC